MADASAAPGAVADADADAGAAHSAGDVGCSMVYARRMAMNDLSALRYIYYVISFQIATVIKFNWIAQPIGITTVGTGNISTAFLILRLMGPKAIWRKWFLYICIALTIIITIAAVIITFAQCRPLRALWEHVHGSKCWNPKVDTDIGYFTASE